MVAHNMPYVATATISHWKDMVTKARKGMEVNGPAFLHSFAPCPRGWRSATGKSVEIARLAVETCVFPLWEAEYGKYQLSAPSKAIALKSERKKPVDVYLKTQGRFRHLFKPENKHVLKEIQNEVDRRWEKLLKDCEMN